MSWGDWVWFFCMGLLPKPRTCRRNDDGIRCDD